MFKRVSIVLQLHTCLQSNFSVECRYRKTSLPLPRYYRIIFSVSTVLPCNFPHPRDNYRGYRGITAFPITVSSSTLVVHFWRTTRYLRFSRWLTSTMSSIYG